MTMTRKQALTELLAKVEAGDNPSKAEWSWIGGDNGYRAWKAYGGSLDAAMALHKSVLPETSQFSIITDPTCIKATVAAWPNGLSDNSSCVQGEGWSDDVPARAWLISILKALIAEEGQ